MQIVRGELTPFPISNERAADASSLIGHLSFLTASHGNGCNVLGF